MSSLHFAIIQQEFFKKPFAVHFKPRIITVLNLGQYLATTVGSINKKKKASKPC